MNKNSLYRKYRILLNCIHIHIWSYLKIYARKYRKGYYQMFTL